MQRLLEVSFSFFSSQNKATDQYSNDFYSLEVKWPYGWLLEYHYKVSILNDPSIWIPSNHLFGIQMNPIFRLQLYTYAVEKISCHQNHVEKILQFLTVH